MYYFHCVASYLRITFGHKYFGLQIFIYISITCHYCIRAEPQWPPSGKINIVFSSLTTTTSIYNMPTAVPERREDIFQETRKVTEPYTAATIL